MLRNAGDLYSNVFIPLKLLNIFHFFALFEMNDEFVLEKELKRYLNKFLQSGTTRSEFIDKVKKTS